MPKQKTTSDPVEPKYDPAILARFSPAENLYTTKSGHKIHFRILSAGTLERVQMGLEAKFPEPVPPMITIDHGKGRTSVQADYNDEGYVRALTRWNNKLLRELNLWIFQHGLEVDIPDKPEKGSVFEASLEAQEALGKEEIARALKYSYVSAICTTDEFKFLAEAVIGQGSITQEGLAQAADDFPG